MHHRVGQDVGDVGATWGERNAAARRQHRRHLHATQQPAPPHSPPPPHSHHHHHHSRSRSRIATSATPITLSPTHTLPWPRLGRPRLPPTSAPDVALGQAVEVGEVACLHELHHQVTRVRQAPGRRTRATLGEGRRRWPRSPPRPRPSTVGEGCTHSARHFSNWFFATSSLRPSSSFFVYYSRGVGE